MRKAEVYPEFLQDGATIAIVGGGPAGTFSALHLLAQARRRDMHLHVVIFEPSCRPGDDFPDKLSGPYTGCPQCAGGISPRLYEALQNLDIDLQPEVIQANISSITLQGNWKSIILPMPRDRKMYSVYRGSLPYGQHHAHCFDGMMLGKAVDAGAKLIGAGVCSAAYTSDGRVHVGYLAHGMEAHVTADFVVFASGVNQKTDRAGNVPTAMDMFRKLQPHFVPPRLRKALIFELEALAETGAALEGELHFIESSSNKLELDMCSILSKRGFITVSLVGKSVDQSSTHKRNLQVIRDFLALPQILRALPPNLTPTIRCVCNPNLVVGTATSPFGQRIAAVGDMATSRLYKDGILSAHNMAESLAAAVFDEGIDAHSLAVGYGPAIAHFRRDNRYANLIFILYRWFFTNPFLSRIIYQTYASEKKAKPEKLRHFKRIFWAISSGDGDYRDIAWSMMRPSTLWLIFWGGVYTTLRNGLAERFFGLDWRGIPRVPTAVSRRELITKRIALLPDQARFMRLGRLPEFECMYTLRIRSSPDSALSLLAQFGEPDRPYLNPRWVSIRRTAGKPLEAGSVVSYSVFGGLIEFSIELQPDTGKNLLVYKVTDGFADGGAFVFEAEPLPSGYCDLTIYLAFDYPRGRTLPERVYWRLFKLMFPEFIHDVLWNHALCEIKHLAESKAPVAWKMKL